MSDREVLDALTVLARRLGLLDAGERLAAESVEVPRKALCLAPAPADSRSAGLLCSWDRSHLENTHSWTAAFVGIAAPKACGETRPLNPTGTGALTCTQPPGHESPHKDARGITWPNDADPNRCTAWGWGTGGHKGRCWLPTGHRLAHAAEDATGVDQRMFMWRDGDGPGAEAPIEPCGFSAGPHLAGALVCDLPKGHKGDHGSKTGGEQCRNASLATASGERPARRCPRPAGHERAHAGGCGPFLIEGSDEWNAFTEAGAGRIEPNPTIASA